MLINKHEVTFNEEKHIYLVDGKIVPSVTQVLKWKYPRKYAGIDESTLQAAADKGTELHNAIEVYESIGLERDDLQEFRDYKFLKKMFKFEIKETESMVLLEYDGLMIAGRLDQVQIKDEKLGLADIKRTATLDKEYLSYQLNLYRLAYQQSYGTPIDYLAYIHLRDGTRKYAELPINEQLTYELLDQFKKGISNE